MAGTAQHNASPDRGRTTHLIGYPHPARISPINNRAPTGWMYGRRAPDSWSGAWEAYRAPTQEGLDRPRSYRDHSEDDASAQPA